MPKVYFIAMTELQDGFSDFLNELDLTRWVEPDNADPDLLAEFAGRLCYRSWAPYDPDAENAEHLNANVTKVRQGNAVYLKNVLDSGHGSVLEHVNFTFLIHGCSRVLTHELVRHRAGMAYSQESLRYCRLDRLEIVIPDGALDCTNPKHKDAQEIMHDTVDTIRSAVTKLNQLLLEDAPNFAAKKAMTSLIRRIAPIGVKTNILFTGNARAMRHIIQMRTNKAAEIEIRQVQRDIAEICIREAPHIFQDFSVTVEGEYQFDNPKV